MQWPSSGRPRSEAEFGSQHEEESTVVNTGENIPHTESETNDSDSKERGIVPVQDVEMNDSEEHGSHNTSFETEESDVESKN